MSCRRSEHLCLLLLEATRTSLHPRAQLHAAEKRRKQPGKFSSSAEDFNYLFELFWSNELFCWAGIQHAERGQTSSDVCAGEGQFYVWAQKCLILPFFIWLFTLLLSYSFLYKGAPTFLAFLETVSQFHSVYIKIWMLSLFDFLFFFFFYRKTILESFCWSRPTEHCGASYLHCAGKLLSPTLCPHREGMHT